MDAKACPHCGIKMRQSNVYGRCAGCGKLLPEGLRAPPGPAPWLGGDIRSIPILDVGERAPLLNPPSPGRSSPLSGDERTPDRLVPARGVEHAVPWPVPLRPTASVLSFWGSGDQTTQPFVIDGDAALRITIESGLLDLRVLCPDGSEVGHQTTMAGPGLALDSIPFGGTFVLEVRASARWGITVVHGPVGPPSGSMPPSGNAPAKPRKRWWQIW